MNTKLNKILAEISAGELIDKITILEIKKEKINDKKKLIYIEKELLYLNKYLEDLKKLKPKLIELINNLKIINEKLWNIEDNIRRKEKLKEFDNEFIEIARSVYKENDKRSKIKLEINNLTNSDLKEMKSY